MSLTYVSYDIYFYITDNLINGCEYMNKKYYSPICNLAIVAENMFLIK